MIGSDQSGLAISSTFVLPNGSTLPNRIAKASMSEGLASPRNGTSRGLIDLYRRWGNNGAGLLLTGNIQIDRRHLERAGNVVFDDQMSREDMSNLEAWVAAAQENGAQLWAQLSHAGRQTPKVLNPAPKSASPITVRLPGGKYGEPTALSGVEVEAVISAFVRAAQIASDAGMSGVQIHGAHGYLINQFLSPLTNQRADRWGGSLEARAQILLQTVSQIRKAVGRGFGLGVKLNSSDFQKGGFDSADASRVAQWLEAEGIDLLEISGGTYESPAMASGESGSISEGFEELSRSTAAREAYFLDYASEIRGSVSTPIMVTGGFRSAGAMNSALKSGATDLVGVARPLAADPDCVSKLLAGEIDRLPAMETQLRLSRFKAFGPNSRFRLMKGLNTLAVLEWHCLQLLRMGNNQQSRLDIPLFRGFRRFEAWEKEITKRWLSSLPAEGSHSTLARLDA